MVRQDTLLDNKPRIADQCRKQLKFELLQRVSRPFSVNAQLQQQTMMMSDTRVSELGVPRQQPHRRSRLATLPSVGAVPQSPHIIVDQGSCCVLCSCLLIVYLICLCTICSFSTLILLVGSFARLPYNLYCVGGDVKHCSIQSSELSTYCNILQSYSVYQWVCGEEVVFVLFVCLF